jgi:hypothetical protein
MESEQAMRGKGFSQEGLEAPQDDSGRNLNKKDSTPVVKPRELIVSRYSFLEAAMRAPSLLLPVSAMTPPPEVTYFFNLCGVEGWCRVLSSFRGSMPPMSQPHRACPECAVKPLSSCT